MPETVAILGIPLDEQKLVYDTSLFSQSNAGHPFGTNLSDREKQALIAFLATL